MKIYFVCGLLLFYYFDRYHATLSKQDNKKGGSLPKKSKPSIKSVIERQLVQKEFNAKDIIDNHEIYCNGKSCADKFFYNYVLGYVTPWNQHGYNISEIFAHKFTHLSPVWYTMKPQCVLDNNGYDRDWIHRVRKRNSKIKIVPRIIFDGWTVEDFKAMITNENSIDDCSEVVDMLIKSQSFDGVVIEIWNAMTAQFKDEMIHFIIHISKLLHRNKKTLILVIPPAFYGDPKDLGSFLKPEFDALRNYTDGFSLMTYDWSLNSGGIGPNSPLVWVKQCIQLLASDDDPVGRYKIFAGLNFYGKDYELPSSKDTPMKSPPEDVIGAGYIERLSRYRPKCEWKDFWSESICRYHRGREERILVYPTLQSIDERLHMADDLNVGIAIWELGQGLDYFYDLF